MTDPTELDLQYNPRLAVPDAEGLLAERREESRAAVMGMDIRKVVYGSTPRECFFAVGRPQGAGRLNPAVIFIHGGYWRAGAAEDNFALAPAITALGAQPIFLGYPLCPDARLREVIEAATRGVKTILAAAGELGIDADRIVLSGTSAGAHLTASLLTDDELAVRICGALLLTGIYDLKPVPLLGVNKEIGIDEADVRERSPLHRVYRGVPSVFAVGGREPPMWRAETFAMAAAVHASGTSVTTIDVPNRNHFDLLMEITLPGSAMNEALAGLIGARQ